LARVSFPVICEDLYSTVLSFDGVKGVCGVVLGAKSFVRKRCAFATSSRFTANQWQAAQEQSQQALQLQEPRQHRRMPQEQTREQQPVPKLPQLEREPARRCCRVR
jgi:hypothetical protein